MLQQGEERYRQLVENLNEGIWAIDQDAVTTFVNRRMAEMLGYSPEEMEGEHLFSFMDERGVEICKRNLDKRRQGVREDHEFELLRKDGSRIFTLMQTSPLLDDAGNYNGALAGVLDITERKRDEECLRISSDELEKRVAERTRELARANAELEVEAEERKRTEQLFRKLLEAAPDAMIVADAEGEIIMANPMTEQIFGYPCAELIGQPVELLVPETLRRKHRQHRQEYAATPHARHMGAGVELSGRRKDGSVFPAEISPGPMQSDVGRLIFCVVRDITKRKQAEQELRESRERFEMAVRGSDAGIWDWDLRSDEIYFSARWKSMLGYREDEIGNRFSEWQERLHPRDVERSLETVQAYLAGQTSEYELEHRLRHKDGSYRWILARGATFLDDDGKPYRMVGSHIDITDNKAAADQLKENEAQLRTAQRIQELLLPTEAPELAWAEIAGATCPAAFAAGDHYDYFDLADGSVNIVIGDVTGHGFSSGLLMTSVHARLHILAEMGLTVDEILRRANASLCRETDPSHFVTVLLAQLDRHSRVLEYVSAGHPTGYVLDRDGAVKAELPSTSMPLAVLDGAEFPAGRSIALEAGDLVLLLTDGVLEARPPEAEEFFGTERTLACVRKHRELPAEVIVAKLCQAVQDFCAPGKQDDDVTAVVVKVREEPGG